MPFSVSIVFVHTQLNVNNSIWSNSVKHIKIVPFQTSQFSISMQFKCQNSPISNNSVYFNLTEDKTPSDATTPDQSGPESNDNKGVHFITQNLCITGSSTSDCLVSYPRHSLRCLTPQQRCNRCILQPHPIGQYTELNGKTVLFQIIQFSISTQFKCKNSSM